MPKKLYTSPPNGYPTCELSNCPLATQCLHYMAYQRAIEEGADYMQLINPTKCTQDETCRFYRNSMPVLYAWGFTGFQKRMFPDQYQQFMETLIGRFGRNPYFERRRGDVALSPREQAIILDTLKKVGISEELKFDNYEENLNWYD